MRKLTILLFAVVLCLGLYAEDHEAASLSYSDINTALALCSDGDRLILPAGDTTSDWSSILGVPNGVSIIGQGSESTIVRNSTDTYYMIYINYGDDEGSAVEISGFSMYGPDYNASGSGAIKIYHCEKLPDIVIHDLHIESFNGIGINLDSDAVSGLIYNCSFKNIYPANLSSTGYGICVHGDNTYDDPIPALGSATAVFVEDSTFEACKHGVVGIQGAHIVVRYNTFRDPISNRGIADIHGYQDTDPVSQDDGDPDNIPGSTWEWYHNTFYGDEGTEDDEGLLLRGGTGVVWSNVFWDFEGDEFPGTSTDHHAIRVNIDDFPADYHVGEVTPAYFWSNALEGSTLTDISVTAAATTYVVKDTDFYIGEKSGYSPYTYPHPSNGDNPPQADFPSIYIDADYEGGSSDSNTYDSDHQDAAGDNDLRQKIAASTLDQDASQVRIKIQDHSSDDITVTAAYIGEQASAGDDYDMESGTIVELTFDSGDTGCTVAQGTAKYSDWVNYTFDKDTDYIISYGVSDRVRIGDTATGTCWYKGSASGDAGTANVTGYSSSTSAYVDIIEVRYPDGDGSQAAPYNELSDINWTTGGDNSIYDYLDGTPSESPTIYLQKGDTWREQMTVGCSGTATYPIVITSYGSGNDPIINGARVIETWTQNTEIINVEMSSDDDNHYIKEGSEDMMGGTKLYLGPLGGDGPVSQCMRFQLNIYNAATITTSYLTVTSANDDNDGAECTVYAEDVDNASQITTFAHWTTALGRKTTASAAWDLPALTEDSSYNSPSLNSVIQEIVNRESWASGNYTNLLLDEDGSSTVLVEWYSHSGTTEPVLHVEYNSEYTWKATCDSEPNLVWFDGTLGTNVADVGSVDSTGDWYWDSNVLYVYYTEDPDGAVVIEASYKDVIKPNEKSYLTFDGLHIKYANGYGIKGTTGTLTHLIVCNCTFTEPYYRAIEWVGDNATIYDNTIVGPDLAESVGIKIKGDDSTIYGNTISKFEGNIILQTTGSANTSGHSVYQNTISDATAASDGSEDGQGIEVTGDDSYYVSVAIYKNSVFDCDGGGIAIYKTDNCSIYQNLVYGCGTTKQSNGGDPEGGINVWVDCDGNDIYGNVVFSCYDGIDITDGSSNTNVKNNIISTITKYGIKVTEDGGAVTGTSNDYNCVYNVTDTAFYGISKGSNSIELDPLMTNPGGDDFTLQFGSPCINKGAHVGLFTDYAGNVVPIGHLPDIGAYEHKNGGAIFDPLPRFVVEVKPEKK